MVWYVFHVLHKHFTNSLVPQRRGKRCLLKRQVSAEAGALFKLYAHRRAVFSLPDIKDVHLMGLLHVC